MPSLVELSFVIPVTILSFPDNYRGFDPYGQYGENGEKFVPEIEEWCHQYLSKYPNLYFYDSQEFEHGHDHWIVTFNNLADKVLFKMQWTDDPRLKKFREDREGQRRFQALHPNPEYRTLGIIDKPFA